MFLVMRSRSRDGCKLRAKSWEMVRSRIGVKTEGALEIYSISARAHPVCLGLYLSHTNYRPTHGINPACSSLNLRRVRPCHFICPRVGGREVSSDSMLSS